ncbi:cingulin-like [Narcine bancroftii]|uniref:cingulin-like n=1 Tax=Narcine bancroftii TaxID=1343680 RepID=UPI003831787A
MAASMLTTVSPQWKKEEVSSSEQRKMEMTSSRRVEETLASGPRHKRQTKGQVLAKDLQEIMLALDREDSERDHQRAEEALDHERVMLTELREDEEAKRRSEVEKHAQ